MERCIEYDYHPCDGCSGDCEIISQNGESTLVDCKECPYKD